MILWSIEVLTHLKNGLSLLLEPLDTEQLGLPYLLLYILFVVLPDHLRPQTRLTIFFLNSIKFVHIVLYLFLWNQ